MSASPRGARAHAARTRPCRAPTPPAAPSLTPSSRFVQMVFPDFIASGEYPGDPGYDTSAQVRASTCMEGAICLDYYFELPADVTTADPIAYSPYVYIDEPKFEAAVSVEMDIILEDGGIGRRELHDDEADKRPLPLVAALKQDLAWLASSGSRRVKPDDVMVSVSMESSGGRRK